LEEAKKRKDELKGKIFEEFNRREEKRASEEQKRKHLEEKAHQEDMRKISETEEKARKVLEEEARMKSEEEVLRKKSERLNNSEYESELNADSSLATLQDTKEERIHRQAKEKRIARNFRNVVETFDLIFDDPDMLAGFREFLKIFHQESILDFYLAVQRFKETDTEKLTHLGIYIYETYLHEKSEQCVPLDLSLPQDFQTRIQHRSHHHIFAKSELKTYLALREHLIPQFIKSETYQKLRFGPGNSASCWNNKKQEKDTKEGKKSYSWLNYKQKAHSSLPRADSASSISLARHKSFRDSNVPLAQSYQENPCENENDNNTFQPWISYKKRGSTYSNLQSLMELLLARENHNPIVVGSLRMKERPMLTLQNLNSI